jgi:membrane-associated phospholipid phosphatase
MSPSKRFLVMMSVGAVQLLYLPINRTMQGGVMLKTPLDEYIPLLPVWVAPYALAWVWWLGCAAWAVWKMDERLYRAFLASALFVIIGGVAWFLLYPTYIQRPALTGSDWTAQWLRFIYAHDDVYNAFPSGHVYLTTLIALYWARWYPAQRGWWIATVVVVALSTLFTRQHYLLDPFGGVALAWAGYRFGLWSAQTEAPEPAPARLGRTPYMQESEAEHEIQVVDCGGVERGHAGAVRPEPLCAVGRRTLGRRGRAF